MHVLAVHTVASVEKVHGVSSELSSQASLRAPDSEPTGRELLAVVQVSVASGERLAIAVQAPQFKLPDTM